jgi:hypothetical protein
MRSELGGTQPRAGVGALVLEWAWSDVPFGELLFDDETVAATIDGLALPHQYQQVRAQWLKA